MSDEFKELLLKDYEARSEAMWKSEQAGETRVNLFIGLITFVGGGLGALVVKDSQFTKLSQLSELSRILIVSALVALLVVGIVTLLRLIARNRNTDVCKHQLDLLRQAYRDQFDTDGSWVHYDIFPDVGKKLSKRAVGQEVNAPGTGGRLLPRQIGGLAYVTSGLNASLVGGIAGLLAFFSDKDGSRALDASIASLVAAFVIQAVFVWYREKSARKKLKNLYPEDNRAGGIVYKMTGDKADYLLVRADNKPDEWVFPKGHIEPDESHVQAALREVSEEAGVVARVAGLIGRIRFDTDDPKEPIIVAKFYLMEKIGEVPADPKEAGRKPQWVAFAKALEDLGKFEESRRLLREAERKRLLLVAKAEPAP